MLYTEPPERYLQVILLYSDGRTPTGSPIRSVRQQAESTPLLASFMPGCEAMAVSNPAW